MSSGKWGVWRVQAFYSVVRSRQRIHFEGTAPVRWGRGLNFGVLGDLATHWNHSLAYTHPHTEVSPHTKIAEADTLQHMSAKQTLARDRQMHATEQ